MTDPTIEEQIRAVCAALPALGWKPGMKCRKQEYLRVFDERTDECVGFECQCGFVAHQAADHDTPPPVLDAAFHLKLETALLAKGYHPHFYVRFEDDHTKDIGCRLVVLPTTLDGVGANPKAALVDAAYRAFGGKE